MVKHLGIVGADPMGISLAQLAALSGVDVAIYDINGTVLRQAQERIKTSLNREAATGKITQDAANAALERVHPRTRLIELNSSEIVFECAIEDLRIKKDLFKHIEADTKPTTVLATTTSALSITAIASATRFPEKFAGFHFIGSLTESALVEVVRGEKTNDETVRRCRDFAESIGKKSVVVNDSPGFVVNRLLQPFYDEPLRVLSENVADIEQIERILRQIGGFAVGPFEAMDQAGLDNVLAARESMFRRLSEEARFRPHPLLRQMVDAGAAGRKTGQGFYIYQTEKK